MPRRLFCFRREGALARSIATILQPSNFTTFRVGAPKGIARGRRSEESRIRRKKRDPEILFRLAPDYVFVVSVATATRPVCYLFLAHTTSSLFRLSIRASTLPRAS